MFKKALLFFLLFLNLFCNSQSNETENNFIYSGRIESLSDNKVKLIGSASSVSFNFKGEICSILLQSIDNTEHHNYVSLELDGEYIGRLKIEKGALKSYPITVRKKIENHHLTIYKATEASNGSILFSGTTAELLPINPQNKKKIEFIGDSITCGMGNDTSETPCGSGVWYDQHNAYLAYGPVLSRALNTDFVLSSVSGIGMYRNWNDEHINESTMPDVYENLYLNYNVPKKPYDFAFQPDLVSICLGTNDLSNGDSKKERLPFNEEKFVSTYINFIKTVYKHAPKTRIILLTSPLVSNSKNTILLSCLKKIIKAFENDTMHKPITLFEFQHVSASGCTGHPDIAEDQIMANQLLPTFKKLLNEK